ncbi:translation initiation factor eIF2B subunit delta-like [Aristolochia californica]|uniref:translation initiation factor eIF2B subunit delta-like n=1 Tax=Aristolochia californica TaxID=171875 RepID=UPI0035DD1139
MDARRPSRAVIDPKVRQVGFITPNDPPERTQSVAAIGSSPPLPDHSPAGTLSPVMIPPPRHASETLSSSLGLHTGHPIPVPSARRPISDNMALGSYNPSDQVLGTSPILSSPSSNGVDGSFSEDLASPGWARGNPGKVTASSFPSAGVDIAAAMKGTNFPPVASNLTIVSVVNMPPGVSGKSVGALAEIQSDHAAVSKPLKERTSKAERRALQETQRAQKAAAKESGESTKGASATGNKQQKAGKPPPQKKEGAAGSSSVVASEKKVADRPPEKDRKKDVPPPRMQFDDMQRVEKSKRRAVVKQTEARNRVELFRHLPQYVHGTQLPELESKFFQLDQMHPAVYKVGLQYLAGEISGGNSRCIAMFHAFRDAIKDYSTPPEKALIRDLTAKIGSYVSFLIECRPLSISMGNAIRFLKNRIAKLPLTLTESEVKVILQSDIDRFINEKIILAGKVIVRHAVTKIRDGDVLLTYGSSSVVEMILVYAHELGKQFRVVVVDSRPKLEGQSLLRRLVAKGLSCTYTHINAVSYVMHEVTRVFLGASSVLANGTVYSRVGTACVAMVAHEFCVPVLICCEAYKFHERVQLDSICSNELGDPDAISKVHGRKDLNHLSNWAELENLQLLNLVYDATPSHYVSMIVTDYGMVPPTSVPVIVREYRREQLWI